MSDSTVQLLTFVVRSIGRRWRSDRLALFVRLVSELHRSPLTILLVYILKAISMFSVLSCSVARSTTNYRAYHVTVSAPNSAGG